MPTHTTVATRASTPPARMEGALQLMTASRATATTHTLAVDSRVRFDTARSASTVAAAASPVSDENPLHAAGALIYRCVASIVRLDLSDDNPLHAAVIHRGGVATIVRLDIHRPGGGHGSSGARQRQP